MPRKVCSRCKQEKVLDLFPTNKRVKSGYDTICKACKAKQDKELHAKRGTTDGDRDRRFKRVFGITLDQYNQMLHDQDYKCAVCGKTEQENKKRLAVDHCHKTNKVRKLLCHHCNCALGMVDDDIDKLAGLISYLLENR